MQKAQDINTYNKLTIGSPVKVNDRITEITRMSDSEKEPVLYGVSGSPDAIPLERIEPIELTGNILENFGAERFPDGWHFSANKHIVVYADDHMCIVDGSMKDTIEYLHEFKNLLYEECEHFTLRKYYGIRLPREADYVKTLNEDIQSS